MPNLQITNQQNYTIPGDRVRQIIINHLGSLNIPGVLANQITFAGDGSGNVTVSLSASPIGPAV